MALMFFDARSFPAGENLQTDLCIIGAGAAGIAFAKEFANLQMRVLLVESGGVDFSHRTQMLYKAQNSGLDYQPMEFTKRRQFGGSTVTWFGRCRPLDEIDFEARPWVEYSGWPFGRRELEPYYKIAGQYLQLPSDDFSAGDDFFKNGRLESKRFLFSPPTNFSQSYRQDFEKAPNLDVLLYANAVHIQLDPGGKHARHIVCKTLNGKTLAVRARFFVLAASALENTRLLLASRDIHPNGIGNSHDLVGRFFMEHPHIFTCEVETLPADTPVRYTKLDYEDRQKNLNLVDAIGLSEDFLRHENLLNACAFFVKRPVHKASDMYYSRRALGLLRLTDILQHRAGPGFEIMKNLFQVLRSPDVTLQLLFKAMQAKFKHEHRFVLRLQMETVPHPESRARLSAKRDALGEPQINLHWKTSAQDVESYRRFNQALCYELAKKGVLTRPIRHDLSADGWPVSMLPAKHAMGTTRMHKTEKYGVVDPDCRVHGVANLYIAGGSVFPTSGMANPTLTIVALAVRLADHIKRLFS